MQEYHLQELLKQTALLIKERGTRSFPPDMAKTPFPQIAEEITRRIVIDFGNRNVQMTLRDWDALRDGIRWRLRMMLWDLAYPEEDTTGAAAAAT